MRLAGKATPKRRSCYRPKKLKLLSVFHFCIALAAVNGAVLTGFERNACFCTAAGAGSSEHFTLATACVFAGIAAGFAALGLVFKTTACVELLLAGGEYEFLTAIFAY